MKSMSARMSNSSFNMQALLISTCPLKGNQFLTLYTLLPRQNINSYMYGISYDDYDYALAKFTQN